VELLVLARHAFAQSNRDVLASSSPPGDGLTPEGIAQAERLREELAETRVDLGAATRFARTRETLDLALDGREVPTIVVPELDEIGFGDFDGGSLDAYRAWAAAETPLVPAPGGGESRAAAAGRFARGLRLLLARPEEIVLFVGHALSLRYVLDAASAHRPAARMAPVEHARPHLLSATEAEGAARLLDGWSRSRAPRFRDPSSEGTAGSATSRRWPR
jgi:broad specificity phosphatase PhoE